MKRVTVVLLLVVCMAAASFGFASASDYEPPPGVLSPDEVDFGGKTVTIVSSDFWKALPPEDRIAEAEEVFNVNIETLLIDNADLMIARIMSGDSTYDIIQQAHRVAYFPLVTAGMLLPADDYLPEEFFDSLPSLDRYTIEKFKYNGKRYGIALHDGVVNDSIMIISYNKDLIERYNQPDPYELYLSGEWTEEALEQIMIAVTQDTNGDGIVDQWGMPDITNAAALIRWAPYNGAELAVRDENGKWVFAYNRENAIHAINTVLRWKSMGIIGNGSYVDGKVAFNATHLPGNRHAQAAGINFGLVPMPLGPHVDRHYYPAFEFFLTCLPANAAEPEKMIALANFLFRKDDRLGFLDEIVTNWMVTKEHLDLFLTANDNWQADGDIFQYTAVWDIASEALSQVLAGTKGAAAAMDEIAPRVQAALDDLFKQ
ncbi:MAG: hypothetical protein WAQ71_07905 [Limnochordia bacterium]